LIRHTTSTLSVGFRTQCGGSGRVHTKRKLPRVQRTATSGSDVPPGPKFEHYEKPCGVCRGSGSILAGKKLRGATMSEGVITSKSVTKPFPP
jgi:DnaJ-class molecular chaperone